MLNYEKRILKAIKSKMGQIHKPNICVRLKSKNYEDRGIKFGQRGVVVVENTDKAFVSFNDRLGRGPIGVVCFWNELEIVDCTFQDIFKKQYNSV